MQLGGWVTYVKIFTHWAIHVYASTNTPCHTGPTLVSTIQTHRQTWHCRTSWICTRRSCSPPAAWSTAVSSSSWISPCASLSPAASFPGSHQVEGLNMGDSQFKMRCTEAGANLECMLYMYFRITLTPSELHDTGSWGQTTCSIKMDNLVLPVPNHSCRRAIRIGTTVGRKEVINLFPSHCSPTKDHALGRKLGLASMKSFSLGLMAASVASDFCWNSNVTGEGYCIYSHATATEHDLSMAAIY